MTHEKPTPDPFSMDLRDLRPRIQACIDRERFPPSLARWVRDAIAEKLEREEAERNA